MLNRRHVLSGFAGLAVSHLALPAHGQPAEAVTLTASRVNIYVRGTDAKATAAMAYNATVPGPLLRYRQGQDVRVKLVNELDQPTAIHWAGYRIANTMDGVPGLTQEMVPPGGSFDYAFTAQDAGTYLYRPYAGENTAAQLAAGLSGVLIVDEKTPVAVDQDHVFIFDDWTYDEAGNPASAFTATPEGLKPSPHQPLYTLNGKTEEVIAVRGHQRLRLRLVNATGTRMMVFKYSGETPTLMAFDGQPCEPFLLKESIIGLTPGQRADLFIDIAASGNNNAGLALMRGKDDFVPVVRLDRQSGAPQRPAPLGELKSLPSNGLANEMVFAKATRAQIVVSLPPGYKAGDPWLINSKPLQGVASEPPLFKVKRGTVVQLAFVNNTAAQATLHIHGHVARLLDGMDDGWKPFWLDTALAQPGQTARVAFIADNIGKWLLKTQLFDQPPRIMGPWFEVT